jgi:hypothetical protein
LQVVWLISHIVQGDGLEAVADLGGAVITGVNGNPLAVMAKQLDVPMHRIDADSKVCPLYFSDGKTVDRALDKLVSTLPANSSCLHRTVAILVQKLT